MDRWLENLQKSMAPARPHPESKEPNVPLEFADLAVIDPGDVDTTDPMLKVFERAAFDVLLKRDGVADASWDSPLVKTAADRSHQRFQKTRAVIERVFAGHPEASAEAIDIVQKMVADERAAVLAEAAA